MCRLPAAWPSSEALSETRRSRRVPATRLRPIPLRHPAVCRSRRRHRPPAARIRRGAHGICWPRLAFLVGELCIFKPLRVKSGSPSLNTRPRLLTAARSTQRVFRQRGQGSPARACAKEAHSWTFACPAQHQSGDVPVPAAGRRSRASTASPDRHRRRRRARSPGKLVRTDVADRGSRVVLYLVFGGQGRRARRRASSSKLRSLLMLQHRRDKMPTQRAPLLALSRTVRHFIIIC